MCPVFRIKVIPLCPAVRCCLQEHRHPPPVPPSARRAAVFPSRSTLSVVTICNNVQPPSGTERRHCLLSHFALESCPAPPRPAS